MGKAAGGPTRVENAKVGLIQFCLSAPKTDMENNVVVSDYAAMDRLLREERKHVLGLCKKIRNAESPSYSFKSPFCVTHTTIYPFIFSPRWALWLLLILSATIYRIFLKLSTFFLLPM